MEYVFFLAIIFIFLIMATLIFSSGTKEVDVIKQTNGNELRVKILE